MAHRNGICPCCGKNHSFDTAVISGRGALSRVPGIVREYGVGKVFLLADTNTYAAAGERVSAMLKEAGILVSSCVLQAPSADVKTVASVKLRYDASCGLILGVGSGVINDVGKLVSASTGRPYIIVATAPSMDGYASATSSMEKDGLKVSLPSRVPDVIIGDAQILCAAPLKLMKAGLGDMLAKYISIAEWRIAHLLWGEFYCEEIAGLVRDSLKRCVENAQGLLKRQENAVMAVFEGLIHCGKAMHYAGLSRPASGVEHYISHLLDMRGAALGTPVELHGLQCAVGTLIAARIYEKLSCIRPDREKALAYVAAFDYEAHKKMLQTLLGDASQSMILQEEKEGKYRKGSHPARLERIIACWDAILQILQEEIPPAQELEALLDALDAPKSLHGLGTEEALLLPIFCATKDIRDKYVLSRLCWDLGILEEIL